MILVIVLIYLNPNLCVEKFNVYQTFQSYIPINAYKYPMYPLVSPPYFPYVNGYTNLPWWNTSLGNTSNMSYDLRGDPLIIPRTNFAWNNGTNFPIYNQSV